jgi:hypothetical protein
MKGLLMLNTYRMMDTIELVELASNGDELTRVLAERLSEVTDDLEAAEHLVKDVDQIRVWLADAEEELAGYRAAEKR